MFKLAKEDIDNISPGPKSNSWYEGVLEGSEAQLRKVVEEREKECDSCEWHSKWQGCKCDDGLSCWQNWFAKLKEEAGL